MNTDNEIREAQRRVMSVFQHRPEAAMNTMRAEATITQGLACRVTEGEREFMLDMPAPLGGNDTGPTPGYHARAAISGCVAIGIKMTAARLGIELRSLTVGVDMDFDNSAMLGMGEASAAPLRTGITIRLDSDADPDALRALVDAALEADPYYLALRDPQRVETRIEMV